MKAEALWFNPPVWRISPTHSHQPPWFGSSFIHHPSAFLLDLSPLHLKSDLKRPFAQGKFPGLDAVPLFECPRA